MPFLSTALIALAIVFLFMPTLIFLVVLFNFRRAPWLIQKIRTGTESDLSETFLRQARSQLDEAEALGWRQDHVVLASPQLERNGPSEGVVMSRLGDPTRLLIGWTRGGFPAPSATFHTACAGGIHIASTFGHDLHDLSLPARFGAKRLATRSIEALQGFHQDRVSQARSAGLEILDLSPTDFGARLHSNQIKEYRRLEVAGRARFLDPERIMPSWWFSIQRAFQFAWFRKSIHKTEKASGLTVQERAALKDWTPEKKTESVITQAAPAEAPARRSSWNWTFASLVAFGVAQGFWLGWKSVPVFLAVLAFHEGGHLLFMRIFGFKDVKVFFIPFLGALATADGKPWGLAPWKRAVVSLAGPLPGLALGAALVPLAFGSTLVAAPWMTEIVWQAVGMLFLLNLFNLLPLGDLDGGQFLQAALFSRFPRAETLFRVGGSAGLAAVGLYAGMPLLAAFAALPLLTLRHHWESAKLRLALRKQAKEMGPPGNRDEAVRRVEEWLAVKPFDAIPENRRGLVRQIVVRDLDPAPMPVWQSVVFVSLYAILWSPVLLVFAGPWFWMLVGPAFGIGHHPHRH